MDFGIAVSETAYSPLTTRTGTRSVCERCGTVLRPDDKQCPSCGNPLHHSGGESSQRRTQSPSPYPPQNYTIQPKSTPQQSQAYTPSKPAGDLSKNIAKCAKCGAIVYEHETRCNSCGRILAPAHPQKKPITSPYPISEQRGKPPAGSARCGGCGTVVFSHQTVCPKCNKPLVVAYPTSAPGPNDRVSRCRRCGHLVYPTDSVCPNCGRDLDPV